MNNPTAAVAALAVSLGACAPGPWVHSFGTDHELAGAIVHVRERRIVDEATLRTRLREADVVLLGEKHDNEDHHRLQAHVVDMLAPNVEAIVFEMMTIDQQQSIVEYLDARPGDTQGLGSALRWSESGWPEWRMYEPIADAALAQDAEIVAGNIPEETSAALMDKGVSVLSRAFVERLGLREPLPAKVEEALVRQLTDAHCGYAPEDRLPAMLLVQRSRDAMMADRLAAITGDEGTSLLVAGAGHVRNDWGVPLYLRRLMPESDIVTIALLEVTGEDGTLPEGLPYDYVWFTPRTRPAGFDHCAAFERSLRRLEARSPDNGRFSSPPDSGRRHAA